LRREGRGENGMEGGGSGGKEREGEGKWHPHLWRESYAPAD